MKKEHKLNFLITGEILVFLIVLFSGCVEEKQKENVTNIQNVELKVFHAGSLSKPLSEIENEFENKYKNVDVQREAYGSVIAIKKVTELHKDADVIASADAFLIPQLMYPDYANFTIKFATNSIVIAYTNKSKYANEINANNWHQILRRQYVKFGFSNPNDDPCGYRSQIVIQLAEFRYNDSKIFDDLVEKNTNIKAECNDVENNLECVIFVPNSTQINPNNKKVMVRSMEVDLISALESNEIDYLFIYRSIAVQHKFNFIDLPVEINLENEKNNEIYKKVKVKQANGKIQQPRAIVYGITIPKNAKHREEAIKFVKSVINEDGRKIFENLGQKSINPAIVDNINNVPEELKELVIENFEGK